MSDFEALQEVLSATAFLQASEDQPLSYRGGGAPPWLLYTWNASLDSRHLPLIGRCLWERLRSFRSRQLASYGYTGLPLVMACLSQAGEPVRGLSVRSERKRHGSLRRIDGPGDLSQPVVVVDDSLVSGTSMLQAIRALEEEGFEVEGCLALVGFPHRGGVDRLQQLGYRVEILFDVYRDLGQSLPEVVPPYRYYGPEHFGGERVDEGLHPAVAARRVAEIYQRTARLPLPPDRFDQAYDGRGGVFVSFRDRATDRKLGRLGYWLFDPGESVPGRDLVLATAMTVDSIRRLDLPNAKICVTFLGPLEATAPAELDYWSRGVVVRSLELPHRMGGALPNTEVFTNELEQYQHARFKNAGLSPEEPHELLTHTLTKCVEPGETWPAFGSPPEPEDPGLGDRLTRRAQEIVLALAEGRPAEGEPLPADLLAEPIYGVGVALYKNGLAGCGVAFDGTLEDCLHQAARNALFEDHRYADRRRGVPVSRFALHVSLLRRRAWLGEGGTEKASRLRRGMDSLAVSAGDRQALFLSHVSVHYSWDWRTTAEQLLAKAGLPATATAHWFQLPTLSWLRRGDKLWPVRFGFPERRGRQSLLDDPTPLARFLAQNLGPDGLPTLWLDPCSGQRQHEGSPGRRVHALWALTRAARRYPELEAAAARGLETALRLPGSKLAEALLLLTLLEGPPHPEEARLAASLRALVRPDGRIVERADARGVEQDLDCLSGAVLLALSRLAQRRGEPEPACEASFDFYRRRFRLCHPWAMVGWHGQAWASLGRHDFARELAEWAIERQHRKTGAFLCDLDPDGFSFHTAFVAEGVAAAGYLDSCRAAFRFMEELRLRPEDTPFLASPEFVGGVRGSQTRAEVRVDYVSHTLTAALNFAEAETRATAAAR